MKKKIYWLAFTMLILTTEFNAQSKTNNLNIKEMEQTMKPIEVVKGFFEAINQGDFMKAKSYMADNHKYVGPMFSTENPEDYFKALGAFEMEFEVETQDMIVSESGITHQSLLKVINPVQATIPCCEVFKISEGKITHQYFYFDTALFPTK